MSLAVPSQFGQTRMGRKIVGWIVFQDEKPVRIQKSPIDDQIRDQINLCECIRWACKDEVITGGRHVEKGKNIHIADGDGPINTPRSSGLLYKSTAGSMQIDIGYIRTASGNALEAVIASSAKEIQHPQSIKVNPVLENIVEGFLCKIGGRPGWPVVRWRLDPPSFQFSANDSHMTKLHKSKN